MSENAPDLLSVREIIAESGMSRRTVYAILAREGLLSAEHRGFVERAAFVRAAMAAMTGRKRKT